MKNIKTARIVYNVLRKADVDYLSELFRFLGIFVWEECLSDIKPENKGVEADICIFVGNKQETPHNLPNNTIYIDDDFLFEQDFQELDKNKSYYPIFNCLTEEEQRTFLYCLMKTTFCLTEENEILKELIDIYLEEHLVIHSINIKNKFKGVLKGAKQAYLNSYQKIRKIIENESLSDFDFYTNYALIYSMYKTDEICKLLKQMIYFPIEWEKDAQQFKNLVSDCENLSKKYPDSASIKLLLAKGHELLISNANEEIDILKKALNSENFEIYLSYIYQKLGKRYLMYHKEDQAKNYFSLANQSKEENFNYFKLGKLTFDQEKYDEAQIYFDQVLTNLESRMNNDYVDPVDLLYLFNVFVLECYIFCQIKKDYRSAIQVGERAIDISQKKIDQDSYFEMVYPENPELYRNELKENLSLRSVYWLLGVSYGHLVEKEKAEQCRIKLKQLELTPPRK